MFYAMFCPIRASKSKKCQPSNRGDNDNGKDSNNNNNNHNGSTHNDHGTNNHGTSSYQHNPLTYKYVIQDFRAEAEDELDCVAGDLVIYEYSERDSNGLEWSHVTKLKTSRAGFVPSKFLSFERKTPNQARKKKLPRSQIDPIEHRHVGSSNGDTCTHQSPHRQLVLDHPVPPFNIPHSLQGSSSKQSFQKYPVVDIRDYNAAPYCNFPITTDLYCGEQYETVFSVFPRSNFALYMVTHNFVAREENDLSVKPGDWVIVLNDNDKDWFWVKRQCDHQEGFVPSRFICDHEQVVSILNKGNSTVTMKSSNQNDFHTYINHRPDRESLPTDQQSSIFPNM